MSNKDSDENDSIIHSKLFSSSLIMLITRWTIKALGLISTIILARLLVPEDFGVVAIAMAIYAFIELFGSFGLSTVLIQKAGKSVDDYNTAWTFKVLFGAFTCVFLLLISGSVANFYDDYRLETLVQVIAIIALVSGLSNIGIIDFQKDLEFEKSFKFQVITKIVGFTVTVILAFTLRNYWALVIGSLSKEIANVVLSFLMHRFRPRFSLVSFSSLFNFSKWLLLNNIIFFLNNRMTDLLIGRLLSTNATGLYAISNEVASIPTTEMAAPINRASFPVYSKLSQKRDELKKAYLNTVGLIFSITIAASVGIYIIAELFVINVLGEKWIGSIELIQWIALSSICLSLGTNNGYIYLASGKPKYSFYIGLSRSIIFLGSLVYCVNEFGLIGAGYAMFSTSIIMFLVTQIAITQFLKLRVILIIRRIYRPIAASLVMFLINYYVISVLVTDKGFTALFLTISISIMVYVSTLLTLWKIWGDEEDIEHVLWQTVKNKINQIFK